MDEAMNSASSQTKKTAFTAALLDALHDKSVDGGRAGIQTHFFASYRLDAVCRP